MQQGGGAPLSFGGRSPPPKQLSYPQRCQNHKGRHVIRSGSRDGGVIHQRTQGSRGAKYSRGVGPQTAANAHTNRQLHGRGHRQQSCPAKTHKIHGHAVPLAARSRKSKTIQILLAPQHNKQGGLLYQAPPSVTSPQHETGTPHTTQSIDCTTQASKGEWGARNKHYCKGVLDHLYTIIGYYVPSSEMRKDFLYFYIFTSRFCDFSQVCKFASNDNSSARN